MKPVLFHRGHPIKAMRPKLNELGRQVARLGARQAAQTSVIDQSVTGGYYSATIAAYGTTTSTVPFTDTGGTTTATADVTRLVYTTIELPIGAVGNTSPIQIRIDWPDLGAT